MPYRKRTALHVSRTSPPTRRPSAATLRRSNAFWPAACLNFSRDSLLRAVSLSNRILIAGPSTNMQLALAAASGSPPGLAHGSLVTRIEG